MAIRGNGCRNHQTAGSDYSSEKIKQGHNFKKLQKTFSHFFGKIFLAESILLFVSNFFRTIRIERPPPPLPKNQTSLMQLAIKEGKLFGRPRNNFRLRSDCEIGHKIHTVQGSTSEIFISFFLAATAL